MNAINAKTLFVAALGAVLAVPPLRDWLERDMARHMLLEFPLLIAAGAAIAATTPRRLLKWTALCDRHGLTGFPLASLVLGYWMIPVALDDSIAGIGIAIAKYASLLVAGFALHQAFSHASLVVQAFFVGNMAWMTATVGLLYQDAPQQLCLYYLASAQVAAGQGLVLAAVLFGGAWCVSAARRASSTRDTSGVCAIK